MTHQPITTNYAIARGLGLRVGVGMLDRPKGWSRDGVGDRDGLNQLGRVYGDRPKRTNI